MIKTIKSLPISEETLGAYLEGKLSELDRINVENFLNNNPELREFVDEIQFDDVNYDESIYDYFPDFDSEFSLPDLTDYSEDDSIEVTPINDDIDNDADIISNELNDDLDDSDNGSLEITDNSLISEYMDNADSYDLDDFDDFVG